MADENSWDLMGQQSYGLAADPDMQDYMFMKQAGLLPKRSQSPTLLPQQPIPSSGSDTDRQQMLELVKQYGQAGQQSIAQQQQGVNNLESQIKKAQEPQGLSGVDWKPLASFYDSMNGGHLAQSVPNVPTPQEKQLNNIALQEKLQQARQGVSKEQLDALKNQIGAYKAARDTSLQDNLTQAKTAFFQNASGRQQNAIDERNFSQIIQDVKKDPMLQQQIVPYSNLSNSLDLVNKADKTPVQQLNELQQLIRGSTGLRGKSGVAERQSDYFHTFGGDASAVEGYLTGKIQSVPDRIKQQMMDHMEQLVQIEKSNLERQAAGRFDQLVGGQDRILKRNPSMKKDLSNFKTQYFQGLKSMSGADNQAPLSFEEFKKMKAEGKIK